MAEINLIPLEEKAQARMLALQRRIQFASIGLLVFTAVITLVILALFTAAVSKKNNLVFQIEDDSAKVNQFKSSEELLVVSKDKASAADNLLLARTDYANIFKKLSTLIPQNVYFTDFRISEGKAIVSGKARTSADVAGLVSSLVSASGSDIVSDVAVDSLSSDEAGIYSFVVSAKLVGGKK